MREGKALRSLRSCVHVLRSTKAAEIIVSDLVVAPKCFQSSHMYRPAPRPANFEQLLMDDVAMELGSGDDHGEHTGVDDELHALIFFTRVQVFVN